MRTVDPPVKATISVGEYADLRAASAERGYTAAAVFMETSFCTGLRPSEVARLDTAHLDRSALTRAVNVTKTHGRAFWRTIAVPPRPRSVPRPKRRDGADNPIGGRSTRAVRELGCHGVMWGVAAGAELAEKDKEIELLKELAFGKCSFCKHWIREETLRDEIYYYCESDDAGKPCKWEYKLKPEADHE